jgi:putative transposase
MDERLKFIARLLDGEKMAGLCREFGILRKTGYKILTRYNEIGLEGLTDRSRRPYRHANPLPIQIETQIVRLKRDKPSWGAPKIRGEALPAVSGCAHASDQHGACGARPPWPGQAQNEATEQGEGNGAFPSQPAQ